MAGTRVVVNLVGEPVHGLLAESRFVERPFLPGGEHNMYELAFAAARAGYEVELRGWLDRVAFDRLAAGAGAAPRVELPARLPDPGELVIVPEGWRDPLEYLQLLLSPARLALFVLAPPGLFGWPFTGPGWSAPDPLTVPLDAVALPEHFVAMHRLGFALLTHSPGLAAAAQEAGVPCALVGTGRPAPPAAPAADAPRPVDVAALTANRWAPLVEQVAGQLEGIVLDRIPEGSNDQVLERLGRARVLLWPSRIEGHATIPWEARSVGCVPVALSSNRFAVGLSEDRGAVVVDAVEELAPAIRGLLADRVRWQQLSARALASAPEEVAWEPYVARVSGALASIAPAGPERAAAAGMGASLHAFAEARAERAQATLQQLAEISAEEQRVRAHRDQLGRSYEDLRARRGVRLVLGLDALRRRLRR